PDGPGPVGGRDAGAHPLPGVHRDGIRGAALVLVVVVLRRQVQPVALLRRQRHADVAGGVPDHERRQLRGGQLRSEDQVALVLPVRVVHHDHRAAGGDVRDRPLDAAHRVGPVRVVEAARSAADARPVGAADPVDVAPPVEGAQPTVRDGRHGLRHLPAPSSRSTYFARTSTSRLTGSPTVVPPSVVSASVVGISPTSNQPGPTAVTVRLPPSTATEPFSATSRASSAGSPNRTCSHGCWPPGSEPPPCRARSMPVPSTWPCTMWPPSRPPAGTARSRLTRSPGCRPPRVLRFSVSAITSAPKAGPSTPTTVRHTPLTAIESPGCASVTTLGPRMTSTAESARRSISTISPSSSTMPVNMPSSLLTSDHRGAVDCAAGRLAGGTEAAPTTTPVRSGTTRPVGGGGLGRPGAPGPGSSGRGVAGRAPPAAHPHRPRPPRPPRP